jgi:hypothetical protein
MFRTVRFPIAMPSAPNPCARVLSAAIVALGAALLASASVADQAYPPGLFENSPVVPSGQPAGEPAPAEPSGPDGPAADAGPPGPDADMAPPGYDAPSGPYVPVAPGRAESYAPGFDYCAGIASRTFHSVEEVRRAHARCDRAYYAAPPPPGYPPRY